VSQYQENSRFKIGYPKVRGANIKKNLETKSAPLKLGEPISRKISIQNWLPKSQGSQYQEKSRNKIGNSKVRGANIKKTLETKSATLKLGELLSRKNLVSKLAPLKLGEPISRKISSQNWQP
jgi:hypothetical protein